MLWSSLKKHSNSRWVQSSYLWLFFVPVAANLLSAVSDTLSFDLGGHHFVLTMALPFSWKLFYFGAVCFSLAGFIYYLACPQLVRDFDSYSEYMDVGKGSSLILDEFLTLSFVGTILNVGGRSYDADMRKFFEEFTVGDKWGSVDFINWRNRSNDLTVNLTSKRPGTPISILPTKFAEAFWFARNASDGWKEYTRWFCTSLYVIGYSLFFFVSCQGFWSVVRTLWH